MRIMLDGKEVLADIRMKGTWVAMGTVTLPAFTAGGAITVGATNLTIQTTVSGGGLSVEGTNSANGPFMLLKHKHTTPEAANIAGGMIFYGYDGAGTPVEQIWGRIYAEYQNVTDTTEGVRFMFYGCTGGAVDNLAAHITGAGVVSGDEAYAQFDDFDDKAVVQQLGVPAALRKQAITEKLAEMGVVTKEDRNKVSGYMLNFQKGFWFNFHALKVAYAEIDILRDRIAILEQSKN